MIYDNQHVDKYPRASVVFLEIAIVLDNEETIAIQIEKAINGNLLMILFCSKEK